jgi:hypothetical protein
MGAQQSLATAMGYVAIADNEPACRRMLLAGAVDPEGLVTDPGFRAGWLR